MCKAVRCGVCGKTTWEGCGQHIDEVRSTVPADQWCEGHPVGDTGDSAAPSV
ncbi:hypothetical protein [Mycobacterium sp.]|uniref:hypothetical protein n=1 Tax=Mycobacterium sp. TaxID=1785 RepID=UPI003A88633C